MYERLTAPTLDWRVNRTKWVVFALSESFDGRLASKSQEAFEDFFLQCLHARLQQDEPCHGSAGRSDATHRQGASGRSDTDLTFSIKGNSGSQMRRAAQHSGWRVYHRSGPGINERRDFYSHSVKNRASPTKTSASRVKDGKIIKATANDTERINGAGYG